MPGDPDGRAERASWLHLALTPGIGPITIARLLAAFGLPEDILRAGHARLASLLGESLAKRLLQADERREAAIGASLHWAAQPDCHLLTPIDAAYPQALLQTPDPPAVLWAQGRTELLQRPALAVVGSRAATQGGMLDAGRFAQALGEQGLTVVSGLAVGIDSAAHRGALSTPGGTIAVLGTGTDRIYPHQQAALASRLVREGLLLSELPPGSGPTRAAFPRRNRLIAGLSLGVLVVEAATHSGSLITARLAADLGREVFAMPGSIHSPTARGCHQLLRQGAKLVESANDVLIELDWPGRTDRAPAISPTPTPAPAPASAPASGPALAPPGRPAGETTPDREDSLLAALGWDPVEPEQLLHRIIAATPHPSQGPSTARGEGGAQSTPPAISDLIERLVMLELSGFVERQADGRFKRVFK